MSKLVEEGFAPCPHCGALNPEVDVFCDSCNRSLIEYGRISVAILIVVALVTVVLFRADESIWPLYVAIAAATLHLYTVVFSRGAAIRGAVGVLTLLVATWALWHYAVEYEEGQPRTAEGIAGVIRDLSEFFGEKPLALPIALWVGGTIWSLGLARWKALPRLKLPSGYFLGSGAFVFGLWGVCAIAVQRRQDIEGLFQFVLGAALLSPAVVLLILLARRRSEETADDESRAEGRRTERLALWFLVLSAYLASSQLLVDFTEFILHHFLPKLVGVSPLRERDLPLILEALRWRALITAISFAIALISIVATATARVSADFELERPESYVKRRAKMTKRRREAGNPLALAAVGVAGAVLDLTWVVYLVTTFVAKIVEEVAETAWAIFRRTLSYLLDLVRYLIAPVVAFSVVSFAILLVVSNLAEYAKGGDDLSALALWGEGVTLGLLALALTRVAFGFAPSRDDGFLFAGTEAAFSVAFITAFLIACGALSLPLLHWGFGRVDVDVGAMEPGALYLLSVGSVLLLAIAVSLLLLLLDDPKRSRFGLQVVLGALVLSVGIFVGVGPLVRGLWRAAH